MPARRATLLQGGVYLKRLAVFLGFHICLQGNVHVVVIYGLAYDPEALSVRERNCSGRFRL